MPTRAQWIAFFFQTPRRFLTSVGAVFFLVCALIPGIGRSIAHNLGQLVGPVLTIAIMIFGIRVMFFGWPRHGGGHRRGGGGGNG